MSQNLTVSQETTDVIAWASDMGASGAFLQTLLVATDGRHHPLNETRRARKADMAVDVRAGGFLTALWNGETERAWNRADLANRKIMATAGIEPDGIEPEALMP